VITALLVAFAVYLLAGQQIAEKAKAFIATAKVPSIDGKHVAVLALLVAAAIAFMPSRSNTPTPAPAPVPPDAFTLRGKFVGPQAASDAATLSALCDELASCIEYDGTHDQRLKTGVAFDELRIAAREARCKGDSIGARQPHVREAVHKFLDDAVGASGGPVTPESRAAWVSALRDLSRAAADVTK
jgi:hypothetical protein